MTRKMIINALDPEEVRIAIVNQTGLLEDFDIETRGVEKNKGNIYKAVVMAVEPALNAAFIDYGADKQGFLTANDVDPKLAGRHDPDKHYRIDELLKRNQEILVQVEKDEVGQKGAVLTTYLSLAGRYTVLMPGSHRQGVSRKIDDDDSRRRMREAAAKLDVPDDMGVIVRTAGRDRSKLELNRDLKVLMRLWSNIQNEASQAKAPALILKEQDVIIRALRDYFSNDISEIVLDADDAYDRAVEYMHLVMPKQRSALSRYVERRPIFHHYKIEPQLEAIYARKVELINGGSIVIEPCEALVAIDVNSGKQKSKDQEATALQTNIEAAKEVARQLRLRDLGGIIVVDFIDMFVRKHQLKVERTVKEALKLDKARVKVGRISPNGTLELTRQRIRTALGASIFRPCHSCGGTGHILNPQSHAVAVLRKLRDRASRGDLSLARVALDSEAANHLRTDRWSAVQDIEQRYEIRVDVVPDKAQMPGHADFTFETNPSKAAFPEVEPDFGPPELPHGYDASDDDDEVVDPADLEPLFPSEETERQNSLLEQRREAKEKKRRRGGEQEERDSGRQSASTDDDADEGTRDWEMPSFELMDAGEFHKRDKTRSSGRKSQRGSERDERGERGGRGRRGGRGSNGASNHYSNSREGNVVSAHEILAGHAAPAVASAATRPEARVASARDHRVPAKADTPILRTDASKPKKRSLLARLFGKKNDAGDADGN
ncbi:MAG: Rne/Rng family ribonuclease [Clostridia bacterium]|nr:Rne/Rng family ribonuclease [Deltaproteobacteria bacterium]